MRDFRAKPESLATEERKIPRVGERVVEHIVDGTVHRHTMSPSKFRCKILAAQLIDEWEFRYQKAVPSQFGGHIYRASIRSFISFIDENETISATSIRLDKNPELFLTAFYEWEKYRATNLPTSSEFGKRQSQRLLSLIKQRATRELPVCREILQRCESGATFGTRSSKHLEEFSRKELQQFIQQAKKSIREDRQRLGTFREVAFANSTPTENLSPLFSLLRATVANQVTAATLATDYGSPAQLPFDVERYATELGIKVRHAGTRPWLNTKNLVQRLVYATERELVPPILMLIYKTGLTYGEIRSMRLSTMIDEGSVLAIRAVKRRANTEPVYRFPITPQDRESPWSVFGLFEYLIWLTQPARDEAIAEQSDLLLMVHYVSNGRRYVKHATHRKYRFRHWLDEHKLRYSNPVNWNRLRKSHHTVRSLNSSDPRNASSGHSIEVFEKHYLSTHSVLEKSGRSYIRSAENAFKEAIQGPRVETEWSSNHQLRFTDSRLERALTESRSETFADRAFTVGKCSDMEDSPFATGGLCNEQVRFCIICPNALILKDHLPQVLLLKDHLEKMRNLSDPVLFHDQYWRIIRSIEEVVGKFSESDIATARESVDSGRESLCIPVSMRVAF